MLKKLRRASTVKLGYTVDVHFRQASIANSVAPNADGLSFVLTRSGKRPRQTKQARWADDTAEWAGECLSFRATLYREKSGRFQTKVYKLTAMCEPAKDKIAVFELDLSQYPDITVDTQQLILPATKSHDDTATLKPVSYTHLTLPTIYPV